MNLLQSKRIWAEDNTRHCDRVLFRKTFSIEKPPKTAILRFAASDTASVYVNGRPVCLGVEGGEYEIAKYLVKGENVLGFECIYFGKPAKGYTPREHSGLVYACDELSLYSDAQTTAFRPFVPDLHAEAAVPYAGFCSYTDGNRGELGGVMTAAYGSTLFVPASEYGEGGEIELSPYPALVYEDTVRVKKMERTTEGTVHTYVFDLGDEKIFYPVLELSAMGTEAVEVYSDRTDTPERWGKSGLVRGLRHLYICRNGIQTYAAPSPCRGSKLIISAPATVALRNVEMHTVRFPATRVLRYEGNGTVAQTIDKCDATMRACMDGGVLDNTDRDRGSDLFALSVFARSAVWTYGASVYPLLRAATDDALRTEDGILRNDTCTPYAHESPIASLMFCSEFGAPAAYWAATGDDAWLRAHYPVMRDYLLTWEYADGLVLREGCVADAGYNTDAELIAVCLYYSAVRFLLRTVSASDEGEKENELRRRQSDIALHFAARYYRGGYFSSGTQCDERAVALAILTDLAGEHANECRDALCSCYNASPAYEGFVAEALGHIGLPAQACARLARRYLGFADGESPVLGEYFFHPGSACAAVATSPVSALAGGVFGIALVAPKTYEVRLPDRATAGGDLTVAAGEGSLRVTLRDADLIVDNGSGAPVTVYIGGRAETAGKGKSKFRY